MAERLDEESIFCLYASPLTDLPVGKLLQIYERLGFKSVIEHPTIMYKYKGA
jgi:predicted GNAT family acetyltransferase